MAFEPHASDIDAVFNTIRSAKYSGDDLLVNEARARMITDTMHGLFHAYLPFDEYERINDGRWGAGGCTCEQCQRCAPRVLEFALSDDIRDNVLERGAGRALASMYGVGWATPEFLALPLQVKKAILKDVKYRTVTQNIIVLLQATKAGLEKLSLREDPKEKVVKDLMLLERKKIDQVLCNKLDDFFEQSEWLDLLKSGATKSDDANKFDLVLESIRRGLTDSNAGRVYQNIVSLVLLRTDSTTGRLFLLRDSPLRAKIEQLRVDTIGWMKKHWSSVRGSTCFHGLEPWVLKDISAEREDLGVFLQEMVVPSGSHSPSARKGAWALAASLKPDGSAQLMSTYSSHGNRSNQNIGTTGSIQSRLSPTSNKLAAHTNTQKVRTRALSAPFNQTPHSTNTDITLTKSSAALPDLSHPNRTKGRTSPPPRITVPTTLSNHSRAQVEPTSPSTTRSVGGIPIAGSSTPTMSRASSAVDHPGSTCDSDRKEVRPPSDDMSKPKAQTQSDDVDDTQPKATLGADTCEGSTLEDTSISRHMTAHEIILRLVAHGCQDLTNEVDETTFGEHPVSHGGFSDIYCGRLHDRTQVAVKALRTLITKDKHLKARHISDV